eukprot:71254-Chlamydomonas_euryale.AAC.4
MAFNGHSPSWPGRIHLLRAWLEEMRIGARASAAGRAFHGRRRRQTMAAKVLIGVHCLTVLAYGRVLCVHRDGGLSVLCCNYPHS